MSRMNSDGSGAQAGSASNVYTLLLIVALVATVGGTIFMVSVNNSRFGYTVPMGEECDAAETARQNFAADLDRVATEIDEQTTGNALKLDVMTGAGAP